MTNDQLFVNYAICDILVKKCVDVSRSFWISLHPHPLYPTLRFQTELPSQIAAIISHPVPP
eukprot:scaffold844_cov268-Chaetoceros_neogracile.AAC.16